MGEEKLNWVQRRGLLQANIPEAWNLICIAIEQTCESFGSTGYAQERKLISTAKRIGNCMHVIQGPVAGGAFTGAIDVCVDLKRLRLFSKKEAEEISRLMFSADAQGKAQVVGEQGLVYTEDQISEFFLKSFLFPESN